jgi:predicted dienelactone hydrolase
MRILRTLLVALALSVALLGIGLAIAWIWTAPEGLPTGSESAARLAPGPHRVALVEREWVDASRPTAANGDQPRAPERRFRVALWYPEGAGGSHPLAVYSHGFVSERHGGSYLAEHLASHGWVVVAADYPLTHLDAPGGPNLFDVVHQPADVSFLIDRVLALDGAERPFEGEIDAGRIGAFGLSLGGVTTTLVAFHPDWRDPRVAAAISIAGVGDVFGPRYFDNAAVPFLMIAGTADGMVDYELNALPVPERTRDGGLVTIEGGTHVGFVAMSSGAMRIFGHPDRLVCRIALATSEYAESGPPPNVFVGLFGTPEQGLLQPTAHRPGCMGEFEPAIAAGRQQMLTTLAVRAFFESRLAPDPDERARHETFLTRTLPAEVPEVHFTPSAR